MTETSPASPSTLRRPPPKSTLFCPDCDRAAPAGDWRVVDRDGRDAVVCPDCETVLTVRSRGEPLVA